MANYIPFDSINHDRTYKAEDWAWYFSTFIGNGIFPKPENGLMVMAYKDMYVSVKAGFGFINGYAFRNLDDYFIAISIGDGVLDRIDRIVLRWDLINRQMVLDVLQGTPSTDPQPVDLTRTADTYELALADINVTRGITTISQANITDRRTNTELCGIVTGTVKQYDFSQFQAQFDSYFEEFKAEIAHEWGIQEEDFAEWFEHMKNQLSEDAAGHLQEEIDALEKNKLDKDGDSKENIVTFESEDTEEDEETASKYPKGWTHMPLLVSGKTHKTFLNRISIAFKNLRCIGKFLGSTDISKLGDGTVTGALDVLNSNLMWKFAGSAVAGEKIVLPNDFVEISVTVLVDKQVYTYRGLRVQLPESPINHIIGGYYYTASNYGLAVVVMSRSSVILATAVGDGVSHFTTAVLNVQYR